MRGIATTNKDDEYVQHEAFINKMPVMQYDDFLNQLVYPINKCLIVGDPTPLHELEIRLAKELEGKMDAYRSADFFLECVPLGIDKARSLDRLISSLGISREEVIACGDGYNDLSMIRFAGLGVAMANAAKDIQSEADFVTLSNEEDGVAHVIETLYSLTREHELRGVLLRTTHLLISHIVNYFRTVQNQYMLFWLLKDA